MDLGNNLACQVGQIHLVKTTNLEFLSLSHVFFLNLSTNVAPKNVTSVYILDGIIWKIDHRKHTALLSYLN